MLASSVEYLIIPLTSPDDITTNVVELSLDEGLTWRPCERTAPKAARLLVGPGTAVGALPVGTHRVLIRITDAPEVPVLDAGRLYVTT